MSYEITDVLHSGKGTQDEIRLDNGGWTIKYSRTGIGGLADIFYQHALYVPSDNIRHEDTPDEIYDISRIMKKNVDFTFDATVVDMGGGKKMATRLTIKEFKIYIVWGES
jgi:hypothetical protein